jgi:hypothetical protein
VLEPTRLLVANLKHTMSVMRDHLKMCLNVFIDFKSYHVYKRQANGQVIFKKPIDWYGQIWVLNVQEKTWQRCLWIAALFFVVSIAFWFLNNTTIYSNIIWMVGIHEPKVQSLWLWSLFLYRKKVQFLTGRLIWNFCIPA